MRLAIIIIDMLEDFLRSEAPLPVGEEGLKIIPGIQQLLAVARQKRIPIIYSCDALLPNDFLFQSIMSPHGIQGTPGAQVISELKPQESDLVVPKRRFSAFFKTDLDITLKELETDTIVIGGVSTEVCIISTAYDSVCNNFRTIILDDCCASRHKETHGQILDILRRSPLRPLLRIMSLAEFLSEIQK